MAKSKPSAPGTYDRGGVCTTQDSPWKQGANKGSQSNMGSPFNAPRVGGDRLPTKIYDSMGGPSAGPTPSKVNAPGTIMTERGKK